MHHEHAASAATAARQQLHLELDRDDDTQEDARSAAHEPEQSPPPQYPVSEASSSRPPPFSSLFSSVQEYLGSEPFGKSPAAAAAAAAVVVVPEGSASSRSLVAAPAYGYDSPRAPEPFDPDQAAARAFQDPVAETKRALPRDTKGESSGRKDDDAEPPPAYSEGDSPLPTFSYVMAAAGGAASIITQVQQGGPPINAIGGEKSISQI